MAKEEKEPIGKRPIRAVLFDVGGVLVVPKEGIEFEVGSRRWSIEEAIRAVEATEFYQENWPAAFRGKLAEDEFWQGVTTQVDEGLVRIYRTDELRSRLNEGVFKLAKELKAAGLKVGLLSNNLPVWFEYWDNQRRLRDIFDLVVLSYEAGVLKPNPEIYQEACGLLGLKPEEVLFIDDNHKNVEAAQNLGLKGLVFRSNQDLKKDLKQLGLFKRND